MKVLTDCSTGMQSSSPGLRRFVGFDAQFRIGDHELAAGGHAAEELEARIDMPMNRGKERRMTVSTVQHNSRSNESISRLQQRHPLDFAALSDSLLNFASVITRKRRRGVNVQRLSCL